MHSELQLRGAGRGGTLELWAAGLPDWERTAWGCWGSTAVTAMLDVSVQGWALGLSGKPPFSCLVGGISGVGPKGEMPTKSHVRSVSIGQQK